MRDPKSLSCCLVEGEEGASLRSPKRRRLALLAAILLQCSMLAALILFPLLVRGERLGPIVLIAPRIPGPRAPISKAPGPSGQPPQGPIHVRPPMGTPIYTPIYPDHPTHIEDAGTQEPTFSIPGGIPGEGVVGAPPWLGSEDHRAPVPVPPPVEPSQQQKRISRLDPGQLVHRVEPLYPPLALQIRLEGTVRLRAVIGTDGAMREVEILGGHPLLVQAARDAVLQWRYKPTVLNGQPVEVETHITVVFTLRH